MSCDTSRPLPWRIWRGRDGSQGHCRGGREQGGTEGGQKILSFGCTQRCGRSIPVETCKLCFSSFPKLRFRFVSFGVMRHGLILLHVQVRPALTYVEKTLLLNHRMKTEITNSIVLSIGTQVHRKVCLSSTDVLTMTCRCQGG